MKIPDSVEYVDGALPLHLNELEYPDNLICVDMQSFIMGPDLKELVIPANVKSLANGVFYDGCSGPEKVILQEGLISIDKLAFNNCPRLREINIPESVNYIDESAFDLTGYLGEKFVPDEKLIIKVVPGSYGEAYCQKMGLNYITE